MARQRLGAEHRRPRGVGGGLAGEAVEADGGEVERGVPWPEVRAVAAHVIDAHLIAHHHRLGGEAVVRVVLALAAHRDQILGVGGAGAARRVAHAVPGLGVG